MLFGSAKPLPSGGVLGDIIYAISHFGVPVFFVVSGYFFLDKNGEVSIRRLLAKAKHIGLLLVGHILLYALYEVIIKLIAGEPLNIAIKVLKDYISLKALVKAATLGTGIMGGGEWFLVSLLDSYVVLGLVMMFRRARPILTKYAHIIASILFLVHIPLRMYIIRSGIETLGAISLIESYAVRNTWLDAIPFMLIGISIRQNRKSIKVSHPLTIMVFAMIIAVGEHFYNAKMIDPQITHDVLYFGIIIAVIMAFIWATNNNGVENWIARIGSRYSMIIYFFHPIVGWSFQRLFCNWFTVMGILAECLLSIVVMSATTLFAVAVDWTKRRVS